MKLWRVQFGRQSGNVWTGHRAQIHPGPHVHPDQPKLRTFPRRPNSLNFHSPHLDQHGARYEAPQGAQRLTPLAVVAAAAAGVVVVAGEQIEEQLDCRGGW